MADSGESSARQIYGFTAWLPAGHVFSGARRCAAGQWGCECKNVSCNG